MIKYVKKSCWFYFHNIFNHFPSPSLLLLQSKYHLDAPTASYLVFLALPLLPMSLFFSFFLSFLLFFYREREGKGGKKRGRESSMWERNINQLPLICTLSRDQTCNLGMCPDQETNWQPFTLWDDPQTTESHWWGPMSIFNTAVIVVLLKSNVVTAQNLHWLSFYSK